MDKLKFMEILEDLIIADTDEGIVDECKITGSSLSVRLCDGSYFVVVVKEKN